MILPKNGQLPLDRRDPDQAHAGAGRDVPHGAEGGDGGAPLAGQGARAGEGVSQPTKLVGGGGARGEGEVGAEQAAGLPLDRRAEVGGKGVDGHQRGGAGRDRGHEQERGGAGMRAPRARPVATVRGRSRGGIRHEAAVGQPQDAASPAGKVGVVCHQDERGPGLTVEVGHQADDVRAGALVEVAGGFIREENLGMRAERPGERHPLLLATGELRWIVTGAVAESDALKQRAGAAADRTRPGVRGGPAHSQVRSGSGSAGSDLEDEPDLGAAERGALGPRSSG